MQAEKSIAILQSSYIPWKGYFDIIAAVDEFVIFDEAQFTRRDWRNRNRIILEGRSHWLSIPVASKGHYDAPINTIEVSEPKWASKHWQTIRHAYGKARFFDQYQRRLEETYLQAAEMRRLTEINTLFLTTLARELGLATAFASSEAVPRAAASPTGRLVEICSARHAATYVSGPAARDYIEPGEFEQAGLALRYANYTGYPLYDQGTATFEHGVSVLDLLFRVGPEAQSHLKSLRSRDSFLDPPRCT
jgi:hypothetical protein